VNPFGREVLDAVGPWWQAGPCVSETVAETAPEAVPEASLEAAPETRS
jgi:hypothetical protein